MNNQYTFQEFLLDCPYDEIQIEDYMVNDVEEVPNHDVAYNLLDYSGGITRRKISLSRLDRMIDTEDDFVHFVNVNRWIDELVIVNDRPCFSNYILSSYSNSTLKAYLYRFNHAGIACVAIQ